MDRWYKFALEEGGGKGPTELRMHRAIQGGEALFTLDGLDFSSWRGTGGLNTKRKDQKKIPVNLMAVIMRTWSSQGTHVMSPGRIDSHLSPFLGSSRCCDIEKLSFFLYLLYLWEGFLFS